EYEVKTNPNVIVFASGVSNSRETRRENFMRERTAVLSALNLHRKLVYFSTCSIDDPSASHISHYVRHKIEMESLIRKSNSYLICRLPQVVGKSDNLNTLINYLFHCINTGAHFEVWKNATRN